MNNMLNNTADVQLWEDLKLENKFNVINNTTSSTIKCAIWKYQNLIK